jgi:hypothetical protein
LAQIRFQVFQNPDARWRRRIVISVALNHTIDHSKEAERTKMMAKRSLKAIKELMAVWSLALESILDVDGRDLEARMLSGKAKLEMGNNTGMLLDHFRLGDLDVVLRLLSRRKHGNSSIGSSWRQKLCDCAQ